MDLGDGPKSTGGDVEERLDLAEELDQHREITVGTTARWGNDAIDDLALQHQHHLPEEVTVGQEVLQNRGRNVVREIGDHPDWLASRVEGPWVQGQNVGPEESEIGIRSKALFKKWNEVGIDLDGGERCASIEQKPGERPLAGANLQQRLPGTGGECRDDPGRIVAASQKILAKSALGSHEIPAALTRCSTWVGTV